MQLLPTVMRNANEAHRLDRQKRAAMRIVAADGTTAQVERSTGVSGWWYFLALILPIGGFFAGIYWLAKNQIGPGLALWAMSVVGAILGVMLLVAGAL